MVSRYLVDWIVISGLVVGTLGLFYLSYGIFGESGTKVVRPILPATLCSASTLGLSARLSTLIRVLGAPSWQPEHWMLATVTVLVFLSTYLFAYIRQSQVPAKGYRARFSRTLVVYLCAAMLIAAAVYVSAKLGSGMPLTLDESLVLAIPVASLVLVYGLAIGSTSLLSERAMQFIGFGLTLLGIATQFLPPILDLLSVKIV